MAERNPFLEVKTIVEPTARPVDTYVQPAPVSDRRLRELGSFIDNMLPRINRFAKVEIQRKEKKDVIRAKKTFADLLDLNLSYDDLVKKGDISAEESPVFRFAYHEAKGESLGYDFLQGASEAYFKSSLKGQTSASGFDNWFNNYKKTFMKTNEATLNELGAFDPFNNITKQAQSSLMNQHLANVRKNLASGASSTSLSLIRKKAQAAIDAVDGNIDQVDWQAVGVDIHAHRSELAKVSKKDFKQVNDETVKELAELFTGLDDVSHFENLLKGMKTSGNSSLADSLTGRRWIAEVGKKINQRLNTATNTNENNKKANSQLATKAMTNIILPHLAKTTGEIWEKGVIEFETGEKRYLSLIAEQSGIVPLDEQQQGTPINVDQWVAMIEYAMTIQKSKRFGKITKIMGEPVADADVLGTLINDGILDNSNINWRSELSKNLSPVQEKRLTANKLDTEMLDNWISSIEDWGASEGSALEYLNLYGTYLHRDDYKFLLKEAQKADKIYTSREEAADKLAESRAFALSEEERKDKLNALNDPVYKAYQASLLSVPIELIGVKLAADPIAKKKDKMFRKFYLAMDHEQFFKFPQDKKEAVLEALEKRVLAIFNEEGKADKDKKFPLGRNEVYVPAIRDNGSVVYSSKGLIMMKKIKQKFD